MMSKLTSRKFWIAVAAGLGSIGTSIAGLATDNEVVVVTGIICATASAAIYAAAEAYVDGASVKSSTSETVTTVTATSTSKEGVDKVLAVTNPTATIVQAVVEDETKKKA